MEPIWIVRTLFVLTMTLCGYWLGRAQGVGGPEISAVAFAGAMFIVALEYASRAISAKKIVFGVGGAFIGLAFSRLFYDTFPKKMLGDEQVALSVFNLFFMYFGTVLALRNVDRISLSRLQFFMTSPREGSVLLDTSAIIDGRVKQLYEMGFMTRQAIVPGFVVGELHRLADSKDAMKRHNGRKGLDNLEALRAAVDFQLLEKEYPEAEGVDDKLILLGKEIGATLVTNDMNLAKVAVVHHVNVLNVNTLAASMRPTVVVGDQMLLSIVKEGKESHQGVGYLDDGTMVVVDHTRPYIGKLVPIVVISMMNTNAGRLAFGRLIEEVSDSNPPGAVIHSHKMRAETRRPIAPAEP